MKLYITRHGETLRNAENRVLGRDDIGLNEKGIAQAEELAEKLKNISIDVIFTSPLSRAKDTANAIAREKGMIPVEDNRIIEVEFGKYEGVPRDYEPYQNAKREHFKRYPGGESYFDMVYRIYDFLYMLRREYADKNVLVVSHGGVCRIIHNFFIDMENEEFVKYAFPNCGLEEFDF